VPYAKRLRPFYIKVGTSSDGSCLPIYGPTFTITSRFPKNLKGEELY